MYVWIRFIWHNVGISGLSLVNTVMNIRVPQDTGNFFMRSGFISFSRALSHGINQ
jgi:hypothetical protein